MALTKFALNAPIGLGRCFAAIGKVIHFAVGAKEHPQLLPDKGR